MAAPDSAPAKPARKKPTGRPRTTEDGNWAVRIKLNEDGGIANPKFEQTALIMAEGFDEVSAWKIASGRKTAGAPDYRRRIVGHPLFVERVRSLMAEKDELEKDPIWGKAAWAISQAYRHAISRNDLKEIMEGAKLLLRLAQDRAKTAPMSDEAETPAIEPEKAGKVGKPVAQSPQSRSNAAEIKRKLMAMGKNTVETEPLGVE